MHKTYNEFYYIFLKKPFTEIDYEEGEVIEVNYDNGYEDFDEIENRRIS